MSRATALSGAIAPILVALSAAAACAEPAPASPFRAMLERPLFSPNRRPPPPQPPAELPQAPAAPVPEAALDVTLSGVIAGAGGGVALLKRPGDAVPVRVARGGLLDGWTLAEVRPRAVVLRRDGRSMTVDMLSPR